LTTCFAAGPWQESEIVRVEKSLEHVTMLLEQDEDELRSAHARSVEESSALRTQRDATQREAAELRSAEVLS